ncbi:MAG: hypothetical protein ACQETD_06620 [Pseudomonadota bacterium]
MPHLSESGARYVVVAICGDWRDGEVTNYAVNIPKLQRVLRKRFMNRLDGLPSSEPVLGRSGGKLPA